MVKTTGPGPGNKTAPAQAQNLQQGKDLNQAEAQKAKQQKGEKLSSSDAARLASQAGFQRTRKKGAKKNFDLGDGSDQQYALPQDEADIEAWSQERLESAQGSLALAGSQFGEVAEAPGMSMGAAIVGSSYTPTEEDIAEMEDLAKRKSPEPIPMLDDVSTNVSKLFGIELNPEVPVGHRVLAAGLVVAGEPDSVEVQEGQLAEEKLAAGIQKVTKRGNQAVGEAQKMNKGINQQLNVQRTFMFRR